MITPDHGIAHERLMQAFADLNRLVEQQAENTETECPTVDVGQQ